MVMITVLAIPQIDINDLGRNQHTHHLWQVNQLVFKLEDRPNGITEVKKRCFSCYAPRFS